MLKSNFHIKSILIACGRGDRTSQSKLYTKYFSFSYNICLRYAKDKKEADLILNEAWLFIFQKIKKAYDKNQFENWLKKMLIYSIVKYHKNNFNEKKHLAFSSSDSKTNIDFDSKKFNYQIILEAIQALPLECRTVFCLFTVDNYHLSEISEMLHLDLDTVNNCLKKGKAELEKSLSKKL